MREVRSNSGFSLHGDRGAGVRARRRRAAVWALCSLPWLSAPYAAKAQDVDAGVTQRDAGLTRQDAGVAEQGRDAPDAAVAPGAEEETPGTELPGEHPAPALAVPAPDPTFQAGEGGDPALAPGDDLGASLEAEALAAPADGEAMIVTAQRFEEDVQKSPVSVNAFSARSMQQRGVTNLQDLSKFTPNLQLQQTNRPAGGGSAYAAYIRGIGTGDFQFPTDPGVGLYVDDVYIARTVGGLLSLDQDIERIEVVKGPQGTLYGRNTIGGAFNVTTSKPRLSGGPTASALVRLGTYGRKDFGLYANAPLWTDRIGVKLAVASFHNDGYGERVLTGERTNSEGRLVVRGGLLFKLTEDLTIRLDGDYSRQDQEPPTGAFLEFAPMGPTATRYDNYNRDVAPRLNPGLGLPPEARADGRWVTRDPYKSFGMQPQHDRYDIGGASARIQYDPADWLYIKSITGVRAVRSDIAVDGDQMPYSLQTSRTRMRDEQYSQELQLGGVAWEDRFTYILGLYFFRENGSSRLDTESFSGLAPNDTLTRFGLTATSYAIFTQESLEILRGLRLTLGGRINRDDKEYDYAVQWVQREGLPFQVDPAHAEAGWTSFIPKAGIDWSPVEPLMLYASYSQGFKSGGFGPSNQNDDPTPAYKPERVTAYEAGFKSHWFEGRRLTLNAAAFYNDYRDIQLTVQKPAEGTGMLLRTTQNAGRSKIVGAEAELTAQPLPGLSLNGGFGYVDATFDRVTAAARENNFAPGQRLPQIPKYSFNAGAQYRFGIGFGELSVRGDVSYKSDQIMTATDAGSLQEAYAIYSARIGFVPDALEGLELAAYGLNLSDEIYYIYRASPQALVPTGQGIAIPGQPRVFFVTARYTY